jgi:ribosome-binding factor A
MKFRELRLQKLIKEELGKLIAREVETGALVTITDVRINKRLERATVQLSILPAEKADETLTLIGHEKNHLRELLMKHVPMKYFPKIEFRYDEGPENAAIVEKRISEIKSKSRYNSIRKSE